MPQSVSLTKEQAEILRLNISQLKQYHSLIGSRFCQLIKNFQTSLSIESNIIDLQNKILQELNVDVENPEGIIWKMTEENPSIEIPDKTEKP